jgi:hypothetical protein
MESDSVYKRGGATGFPPLPLPDYPFPPVRQAVLFPPRLGNPSMVPTIMDVLGTNRLYPDARGRVSGYAEPGYSGTSRPATSWM